MREQSVRAGDVLFRLYRVNLIFRLSAFVWNGQQAHPVHGAARLSGSGIGSPKEEPNSIEQIHGDEGSGSYLQHSPKKFGGWSIDCDVRVRQSSASFSFLLWQRDSCLCSSVALPVAILIADLKIGHYTA